MKKFLLLATSVGALAAAGVAQADHNYAGAGLGWVLSRASVNQTVSAAPAGIDTASGKLRAKDNAPIGKIFVGHAFGTDSFAWLTEVSLGLDGSVAKGKQTKRFASGPSIAQGVTTTSLKRQGIFGIGLGASGAVTQSISVYGKASLLLARMRMSTSSSYPSGTPVAIPAASLVAPNFNTKTKWKWGAGLTIGCAKSLSDKMSLGLDYTFETFQKIKLKGSKITAAATPVPYSGTMKPIYHTLMMNISQKF